MKDFVDRDAVEQAWANREKVIRAAIRLRHSIQADNEISKAVVKEGKKFNASVQQGQLPPPLNIRKVLREAAEA